MQPNRKPWEVSKTRADIFLPEVRTALAKHLILIGSVNEDREQGTDLVVLRSERQSVGVRIRDVAKYFDQYRYEVTIRSKRPSGAKTELAKLEEGWIDMIFYGFGDYAASRLMAYRILDCRALRAQMIRGPALRFKDRENADGVGFRAYDARSLTAGVEIEKWWHPDVVRQAPLRLVSP